MRVCVVGSGGREHALASTLARTADVVVTPGNPGIAAEVETTTAGPEEIGADLYVIGPEVPLVDGLADRLRSAGRSVFGPGADGARLEGSKAWMKEVLASAGVPTAHCATFSEEKPAIAYLQSVPGPWVVKTDGLAAGKGVLVTDSLDEAVRDVRDKIAGRTFAGAGSTVVVEECMVGTELSVLAICDGHRAVALAPAQDFKRIGDGDLGANTGGMGAYSPVDAATPAVVDLVVETCIDPLVAELLRRGIDYRGVLYAGLMMTAGGPKVVEFNVRFGDPEAQVVLTRFDGDLAGLLAEAADGSITTEPAWHSGACVTVVLAAEGYPDAPRTGDMICGVGDAGAMDDVVVYHAGTALGAGSNLVTAGGRVLDVTAVGPDLDSARRRAYAAVSRITWPGMQYRTDIARQAARGADAAGAPPRAEALAGGAETFAGGEAP